MKRQPKSEVPEENPLAPTADATAILQVKVWLTGYQPDGLAARSGAVGLLTHIRNVPSAPTSKSSEGAMEGGARGVFQPLPAWQGGMEHPFGRASPSLRHQPRNVIPILIVARSHLDCRGTGA